MNIGLLCEETKKGINVDFTSVFTFIGVTFCIIVAIIAIIWLTCFMVRLLSKTFKAQINNSYDVYVENSTAKAQSKKQRNEIKRKADDERKMEILNKKLESKARIHRMKLEKLENELKENEEKAKEKYAFEKTEETAKPAKIKKEKNEKPAEVAVETKEEKPAESVKPKRKTTKKQTKENA